MHFALFERVFLLHGLRDYCRDKQARGLELGLVIDSDLPEVILEARKESEMDGYNSDNDRKKLWDELSRGIEPLRVVVVHLTKGDGGFGFNIRGGLDHPHVGSDPGIFITTVKADSVAGRDGRLEPGDRILALNDIRLDCVAHDVAVDEFRKADESVSLLVEKNAETYLLSRAPSSPDHSFVDGPMRLDSPEEEAPPTSSSLVAQFYESKLGALSIGLAVGSLAVFIFLKMYKATKS